MCPHAAKRKKVYQISNGTVINWQLAAFGVKLPLSKRDWIRVQSSWALFRYVDAAVMGRVHAAGKSV
ncbi:hypothetical protein GH733_009189 [Mirounga leonina]|nr:hypothetical protein GH733_009189 [Mirounga leonina]